MKRLLIIEDDVWISHSLKLYLENSNLIVDLHHEWWKAVKIIKDNNYDLVILDINLPVKDGIQICKEVREFSQIPIIMLTARSSELDRINWLEIWADDYIAKPFSPRELLARINSIIRRLSDEKEDNNFLTVWNIKINTDKKIVSVNNIDITLTKNEYDILKKIIEEDWKLVLRETLMTEVIWYEKYVYDRTIDTHIKNLRKKIGIKDLILTVRWEWYRLNK